MSKQFIHEGDTVKMKQQIANSPEMIVEAIDKMSDAPGAQKTMLGIRCFWFASDMSIQKNRFNFKDLVVIKKATSYDK